MIGLLVVVALVIAGLYIIGLLTLATREERATKRRIRKRIDVLLQERDR